MQYNMRLDNGNYGKPCRWMVDIFHFLVRSDYKYPSPRKPIAHKLRLQLLCNDLLENENANPLKQ